MQTKPSFRDCLRDAWLIFRKNWLTIAGFCIVLQCISIFFDYVLQRWFTHELFESNTTGAFLRLLVMRILRFAAIVFIVSKSLLLMRNSETKLRDVRELLKNKAVELSKLGLAIALIISLPTPIFRWYIFLDNTIPFIELMTGFAVLLWALIIFSQIIYVYCICHIINGNSNRVLWKSILMIKTTTGKLIKVLLLFIAYCALIGIISVIGLPGIVGIVSQTAQFAYGILMTVIYYNNR